MRQLIASMILMLFIFPAVAAESASAIAEQQDDQDLCVQQRLQPCLDKCQASGMEDCQDLCEENIKNKCLQAGE